MYLFFVDTIELPEEIDINRAKRNADRAKEELLQKEVFVIIIKLRQEWHER